MTAAADLDVDVVGKLAPRCRRGRASASWSP